MLTLQIKVLYNQIRRANMVQGLQKKLGYAEKKSNCVQGGILITPDKSADGFAPVFWDTVADYYWRSHCCGSEEVC